MQQRVLWRGYGSLPGSKRHCLPECCVKGKGSSQGRQGLWKTMSLAGDKRRDDQVYRGGLRNRAREGPWRECQGRKLKKGLWA